MKLPLIKGTMLFLGNHPVEYIGDGAVELRGVDTPDQLAERLAGAGQKIYGQYVAALAHDEIATKRDGAGEQYKVKVRVTYVAGGARHEEEISEREPIKAAPLPPLPPTPQPEAVVEVATPPVAEAGGETEAAPLGTVVAPEGEAVVEPSTAEVTAAPAASSEVATGPGGERREKVRRLMQIGPPPEGERRVLVRRNEDIKPPQA